MGRPRGLEPPTSGTTNRRSNQLSYDRHIPIAAHRQLKFQNAPRLAGVISTKSAPSSTALAGASLLHNARGLGSENCAHHPITQDYFTLAPSQRIDIEGSMPAPGESSEEILRRFDGVKRVPSPKAEIFVKDAFLPPDLCEEIIGLIDLDRRPSTLADYNGDASFRTSETCDLRAEDAAVKDVEARLFDFTQIDAAHGEPLQGQRYEVGQEFKQHTDWFNPDGPDWEKFCSVAGQRTWTFMVYLNTVEAGGATRFKTLGKKFQPVQGRIVGWNNLRPDRSGNVNTLHHAMKVRKGVKYVITKWYRERPWG